MCMNIHPTIYRAVHLSLHPSVCTLHATPPIDLFVHLAVVCSLLLSFFFPGGTKNELMVRKFAPPTKPSEDNKGDQQHAKGRK